MQGIVLHLFLVHKTAMRGSTEHLKSWVREHHFGNQNAQRCPRCKVSITTSRTSYLIKWRGSTVTVGYQAFEIVSQ